MGFGRIFHVFQSLSIREVREPAEEGEEEQEAVLFDRVSFVQIMVTASVIPKTRMQINDKYAS